MEKIAVQADPKSDQELVASQLKLLSTYYDSVLVQATRSFLTAIILAIIGFVLFITAVIFFLFSLGQNIAYVSLAGGALMEVISGVNFYLYGRASDQLGAFHIRLDRIERFLLANSACEKIEGEVKDSTRSDIVKIIVEIPPIKSGSDEEDKKKKKNSLRD